MIELPRAACRELQLCLTGMDGDVPFHTVSGVMDMVLLQFESDPALQRRKRDLLTWKYLIFARRNLEYRGLVAMLHHVTGYLLPAAANLTQFYFDIDHADPRYCLE